MKVNPILAAEIAGGALLAFLVYKAYRYVQEHGLSRTAENLAGGAVSVAEGATVGAVKGVGGVLGVEDTNLQKCADDMAAGNKFGASFSCPLPIYAKYVASGFNPVKIEGTRQEAFLPENIDPNYSHEGRGAARLSNYWGM